MTGIKAIFTKQLKETLKNKAVLIQFLMFPLLTVIMETAVKMPGMPEHFFAKLFAVMFIGMAPLSCMSSIIAEEKEKNTLRALMMCNVKPVEYLLGIGSYIFILCMAGSVVFGVCGEYKGVDFAKFIAVMAIGIILSMLAGAVIGIASKNQMSATSISVPVMLIFSILPMLALFNENIGNIARATFSQQINSMISSAEITSENITVIAINFLLAAILFTIIYKKKGLE